MSNTVEPEGTVVKQTNKVSWGPSSTLLLLSFLGSLIPFIEQTAEIGAVPSREALLSFGLLVALGLFRTVQQIVLDTQDRPLPELGKEATGNNGPITIPGSHL